MTKELWTALIDLLISLILYFGAKYFTPSIFEDVKFVIAAIQPFVAVLLLHFYGQSMAAFFRMALYKDE